MNRHTQHYLDLNPQTREPRPLAIVAGAALAMLAIWAATFLAFTL